MKHAHTMTPMLYGMHRGWSIFRSRTWKQNTTSPASEGATSQRV